MIRLKVITRDASGHANRVEVQKDSGIKVGDITITSLGYMIAADVPVARTGIQEYSALELGLDASMKTIRLWRPAAEVFAEASMASLDRKPVTFYHPENGVDASNWTKEAKGRVETPTQAGDFLQVRRFEVNDKGTVEAVAFGVKEVSCGYTFTLDMTPGVTPEGESYDGVQRGIEHNHVAIVYAGRCGAGCAIGDCACSSSRPHNDTTEQTMKINIGGIDIELDDKVAQTVKSAHDTAVKTLTDGASAATKRATDAETALKDQGEAMKKLAVDQKTALDAAEAKVPKPEQITAMVVELAAVAADAARVLPEFDATGKTAGAIRVEVLTAVLAEDGALKASISKILGGVEPTKATDVRVLAAFDTVVATAGTSDGGENEREIVDAIVGDKKVGAPGKPQKLSGRALMVARSRGKVAGDAQRQ